MVEYLLLHGALPHLTDFSNWKLKIEKIMNEDYKLKGISYGKYQRKSLVFAGLEIRNR